MFQVIELNAIVYVRGYNQPGREEDIEKSCLFQPDYQTTESMDPKEFPKELHAGKRKGHQPEEELVSQNEVSNSSEDLTET